MTAEESALLLGIVEDQDSDTPRLVMADLYDEQGRHLRADFVRKHVELAATPARTKGRGKLTAEVLRLAKAMAKVEPDFAHLCAPRYSRFVAPNAEFWAREPTIYFAGRSGTSDNPLILSRGFVRHVWPHYRRTPPGIDRELFCRHPIGSVTHHPPVRTWRPANSTDPDEYYPEVHPGLTPYLCGGRVRSPQRPIPHTNDTKVHTYPTSLAAQAAAQAAVVRWGRCHAFPHRFPKPPGAI